MSNILTLLVLKPGIQKDGTLFQGEACTEGHWTRFRRGKPRKMGGMKAINISYERLSNVPNLATNLLLVSASNQAVLMYVGNNMGVYKVVLDEHLNLSFDAGRIIRIQGNGNTALWESTIIIYNNKRTIVFMKTLSMQDITSNSTSTIYYKELEINNLSSQTPIRIADLPEAASGGMVWVKPYLIIYGSNGYVRFSTQTNPFVFEGGNSGDIDLGISDKVIYAAPVRGGANSPCLLFWTLSSVIRVSNSGVTIGGAITFTNDIVSNSSTILSSRCVVEHNGVFYWIGTDKFYVYNGIVDQLINNTNRDYFFRNLDLNKRQSVFGVKHPAYDEIWWHFPEIVNSNDPTIGCTHAVIYNFSLNVWYDTAIERDAGMYFSDIGSLFTYGSPFVNRDNNSYIWQHEVGINQLSIPPGSNASVSVPIVSFFTTPIFSWAGFNPTAMGSGNKPQTIDRWIALKRIEPDFVMNNFDDEIELVVNSIEYAQSPVVRTNSIAFTRLTDKLDLRVQGRQLSLTFTSTAFFEMGNILMLLSVGDVR